MRVSSCCKYYKDVRGPAALYARACHTAVYRSNNKTQFSRPQVGIQVDLRRCPLSPLRAFRLTYLGACPYVPLRPELPYLVNFWTAMSTSCGRSSMTHCPELEVVYMFPGAEQKYNHQVSGASLVSLLIPFPTPLSRVIYVYYSHKVLYSLPSHTVASLPGLTD